MANYYNDPKISNLNPDTVLTLCEFLELFNDDNENPLWDRFMLVHTDEFGNDVENVYATKMVAR